MRIKLVEVTVENVTKGKNAYGIATVAYRFGNDIRQQKILSFANPDVFKKVQEFPVGAEIEVEVTKNAQGYNQWAKADLVVEGSEAPKSSAGAATGGKVLGNQYETREERLTRQLHIVRQSSISNAVATLAPGSKGPLDADAVLAVAQRYVDFVYDNSQEALEASFGDNEAVAGE